MRSTSVARAGSSLFPTMPCMVGRRFITPKDNQVTSYLSCPRPWESVVQLEILPTPTLSPRTVSLSDKWSSHPSNFIRKNPTNFFLLHFGSRCLEEQLVYCELGCRFTATGYKFPMCILLICIKAAPCSVAAFPRCTMQSFSYVLKWADRNLAHIYTINTDPNGCSTKPYNILEFVWSRWSGWY